MIDTALSIVAPHYCYNCQKTGSVLCDSCKYDIVDEAIEACIICNAPEPSGICVSCRTFYEKAWHIGSREGALLQLINDYKFERVRVAYKAAADLLDMYIPDLPADTVVVPIPTIAAHIRQRGYDHTALIAKAFARKRGLTYTPLLKRATTSHQRGASRSERFKQAAAAFSVGSAVESQPPYLLIDDVLTTGATLQYAAKTLHDAGAQHVWAAIIARQPIAKPIK